MPLSLKFTSSVLTLPLPDNIKFISSSFLKVTQSDVSVSDLDALISCLNENGNVTLIAINKFGDIMNLIVSYTEIKESVPQVKVPVLQEPVSVTPIITDLIQPTVEIIPNPSENAFLEEQVAHSNVVKKLFDNIKNMHIPNPLASSSTSTTDSSIQPVKYVICYIGSDIKFVRIFSRLNNQLTSSKSTDKIPKMYVQYHDGTNPTVSRKSQSKMKNFAIAEVIDRNGLTPEIIKGMEEVLKAKYKASICRVVHDSVDQSLIESFMGTVVRKNTSGGSKTCIVLRRDHSKWSSPTSTGRNTDFTVKAIAREHCLNLIDIFHKYRQVDKVQAAKFAKYRKKLWIQLHEGLHNVDDYVREVFASYTSKTGLEYHTIRFTFRPTSDFSLKELEDALVEKSGFNPLKRAKNGFSKIRVVYDKSNNLVTLSLSMRIKRKTYSSTNVRNPGYMDIFLKTFKQSISELTKGISRAIIYWAVVHNVKKRSVITRFGSGPNYEFIHKFSLINYLCQDQFKLAEGSDMCSLYDNDADPASETDIGADTDIDIDPPVDSSLTSLIDSTSSTDLILPPPPSGLLPPPPIVDNPLIN